MAYDKSIEAFDAAYKVIPGGVDSPVRAFSGVEGTPPFIAKVRVLTFLILMETDALTMYKVGGHLFLDTVMLT